MYGVGSRTQNSRITGSLGVAIVDGQCCEGLFIGTCEDIDATIGLPLAIDVAWIGLDVMALGVHGFVDINSEESFGGVGLTLELGRMR